LREDDEWDGAIFATPLLDDKGNVIVKFMGPDGFMVLNSEGEQLCDYHFFCDESDEESYGFGSLLFWWFFNGLPMAFL
jgi:hypothetical protein